MNQKLHDELKQRSGPQGRGIGRDAAVVDFRGIGELPFLQVRLATKSSHMLREVSCKLSLIAQRLSGAALSSAA